MVGIFNWLKRGKAFNNCYFELCAKHVKDIMVDDVMTIGKYDKLIDAAHIMIGAHISCLVVIDGDKPIGILTERDFIKKLAMSRDHSDDLLVSDLMTKEVFVANSHLTLFEAQKIMREHKFRKLVVVEGEALKGILTQTDLCRAVAEAKSSCPRAPRVKDIMTKSVFNISGEEPFNRAKKIMASKDIGSVLVMEKGVIMGMFTEFDLVSEFFMNPNRLRKSYMKDLMTSPVICVGPNFDIFEVNRLMLEHNFRRLPVMESNKVIGIITQTDVAWALYEFIEKNKDCSDERTRKKQDELKFVVRKTGSIILYSKPQGNDTAKGDDKKIPDDMTE
ncbi:CBS domain-containing protein [Candidatus Woesearchaeota archaeon]|nr:CBS domain-containing protein [Candidatus Woesearchaeota archaeon]